MSKILEKIARGIEIVKAVDDDGVFEGYLSTFGNEDSYGDTIHKGSFTDTIKAIKASGKPLPMLWSHNRSQPIGVYTDLAEDNKGLFVRGELALGVKKADETQILMRKKAVTAMSLGGYIGKNKVDPKTYKRDIYEIELREGSPVVFPANDKAVITSVKSIEEIGSISDLEALLREVGGFSREQAKVILAKAKGFVTPRDAGVDEVLKTLGSTIRGIKF